MVIGDLNIKVTCGEGDMFCYWRNVLWPIIGGKLLLHKKS